MKKIFKLSLFFMCVICFTNNLSSQTWSISGTNLYLNPTTANLGVGVSGPSAKLHLNSATSQDPLRVQINGSTRLWVNNNGGTSIGAAITPPANGLYVNDRIKVGVSGNQDAITLAANSGTIPELTVRNAYGSVNMSVAYNAWDYAVESKPGDGIIRKLGTSHNLILYMSNNNNDGQFYVAFGDAYNGLFMKIFNNRVVRLDGKLYAKEIEVKTNVWSDFVFNSDYKLMPLSDVEAYIKANKHLPDVPSEEEVINNGIDVAKMDALLLQKIEELTLYLIDLQKENQYLKSEIDALKQK